MKNVQTRRFRGSRAFTVAMVCWLVASPLALAQDSQPPADSKPVDPSSIEVPQDVAVDDVTDDERIESRLREILTATEWFTGIEVRVDRGVVFLKGQTSQERYQQFATELAQRTRDVVAVVNNITVLEPDITDFSEATNELQAMSDSIIRALPRIAVSAVILLLTLLVAFAVVRLLRWVLAKRIDSRLLVEMMSRVIGFAVFLLGIYLILRVLGLTRLAVTVLGGTGLFGLILGIAFRDIAENFLASLLISMHRPFRMGDTIEVDGNTGIVQRVTTRGTLLMALDGTFIQIPNSTIYKNTILNLSANRKTRRNFTVGVGYDCAITDAQNVAMGVLRGHPAVLDAPEPMVLVDALASSTVILRVYFWYDFDSYDGLKVTSAILRLIKRAFQENGISMPDEAREIIFPQGVRVRVDGDEMADVEEGKAGVSRRIDGSARHVSTMQDPGKSPVAEAEVVQSDGEGSLESEHAEMQKQARESDLPEEGEDLLNGDRPE
ncbi:MAG: mechanosensitive ion channel domain-containing protein [Phycisphaerales bacterium]